MHTKQIHSPRRRLDQAGLTLIELMVSLTIGLLITGALATVFVNTSRSFRDLQKSRDQIENGRYAMTLLADEIRHAGYYGQLGVLTAPTGAVDPCHNPVIADLFYPVQVYSATLIAQVSPLPTCLGATEVSVGSDILVLRRTSTIALTSTDVALSNQPYLQADPSTGEIQLGSGAAVGTTLKASGTTATILNKSGLAAPINKLNISIYYISPCSQATCGSAGDGVPTLKRIDLQTGGASPVWSAPVPLVSGIEYLQLDLGTDTSPTDIGTATGTRGDGMADGAFTDTLPVGSDWNEVVSMRVNLLARTLETTTGAVDSSKTYGLGVAGTVTGYGTYKRHVFSAEVRLNNVAGRRERMLGE